MSAWRRRTCRYGRPTAPASGWLAIPVVCAAVLMPVTDAAALWDDKLELFVAESVTYDDNVFRISSQADPVVAVGSSSRGDTYTTTSPGFNFNIPLSRQRFVGGVKWIYTRYNRFKELDFDGHEGRAVWQWRAGNDLSGQLGYSETLAIESLANSRAGVVLTGTPNALETQRAFFDATYELTPRWRLGGEASRLDQDNSLASRAFNNIIIEGAGLAVSYVTPAMNQLGLGARVEEGRYPNRDLAANPFVDPFRQYNVDVITEYTITGHSRVRARAGWVSRSNEQQTQRDFDEGTYRVDYDWQATGKLAVNAVARREVSPLDGTYSSFVLLTGFALNPTLRMTEKSVAAVNLEYGSRDYLADPSLLVVPSRTDWVRTAALKFSYRPLRSLTVEMTLAYQTRSSTFPLADYEATVANLGVRLGF